MAHALTYVDTAKPAPPGVRAKRRNEARFRSIAALKQRSLVARLRRKAALADNPANWVTLTGMSDEQKLATIMGR